MLLFPPETFHNEPELDFAQEDARSRFRQTLTQVRTQLGQTYALVINNQDLTTTAEIVSSNPARPGEIVGRVAQASIAEAERSVAVARTAFPPWRARPAAERADFLFRAAAEMQVHRLELAAWEVLEAAKPWREADADVCEAIDYFPIMGTKCYGLHLRDRWMTYPVRSTPMVIKRAVWLSSLRRGTFRWRFSQG